MVPLWIGADPADRTCHRRTNIETTEVKESAIHALMMSEAGTGGYFMTRIVFRPGSAGSGSTIPASSPERR
jgi:hypothetical protein